MKLTTGRRFPLRWLLALMTIVGLLVLWAAGLLLAQSPIGLDAVEPREGRPGQEMQVRLYGHGLGSARRVNLSMDEIQVLETHVVSDEEMDATIRIPDDAPPGPRRVEVMADFGPNEQFAAELPDGFVVLEIPATPVSGQNQPPPSPMPGENEPLPTPMPGENEPSPTPMPGENEPPPKPMPGENEPSATEEGGGLGVLLLLLSAVLLGVGAISLTLRRRRAARRREWESYATDQELPQSCQKGSHFVRREKMKIKPGRWKVTGLTVTLYDALRGEEGTVHEVPPEVVKKLDKAARRRLLRGDSSSRGQEVEEIARELMALILAWQSLSLAKEDIFLKARLEGGKAEVTYVRYHCAGSPGQWRKQDGWTITVKAVEVFPRTLPGPARSRRQETYVDFLSRQMEDYIQELVQEAAKLF